MLTRNELLALLEGVSAGYERLQDVCNRSSGIETVFIASRDVYRSIFLYELDNNDFLINYDAREMMVCGRLYGTRILVVNEASQGTFFAAAICRSEESYHISTGLQCGDLLVEDGQLYGYETEGQCFRFVETGLSVSNGVTQYTTSVSDIGAQNDVIPCSASESYIFVHELLRGKPTKSKTRPKEPELAAGDTRMLDEFLKSFSKNGHLMQMGG